MKPSSSGQFWQKGQLLIILFSSVQGPHKIVVAMSARSGLCDVTVTPKHLIYIQSMPEKYEEFLSQNLIFGYNIEKKD